MRRGCALTRTAAAVAVLIALGLAAAGVARRVQTKPHEKPPAQPWVAMPAPDVRVLLEGCMVDSAGGGYVSARAVSLLPVVRIESAAASPRRAQVALSNLALHRARAEGPGASEAGPATLRFTADLAPGERREWRLTPAGQTDAFTFFVVGDTQGRYEVLERVIADANREKPLFVINLGDLAAYNMPVELRKHREAAAAFNVPYFTMLGDHDLARPGLGGDQYSAAFGPTYYAFAFGNARFIALDNAAGYVSRRQVRWLRRTLAAGAGAAHTFVFAHQPLFDPRRGEHHAMKPLIGGAEAVGALLKRHGVRVFFAGHIHSYYELVRRGVTHVITGGGGGDLKSPFPRLHYVVVNVRGADVRWEVRQVGGGG